jgi:hypothetical protein
MRTQVCAGESVIVILAVVGLQNVAMGCGDGVYGVGNRKLSRYKRRDRSNFGF